MNPTLATLTVTQKTISKIRRAVLRDKHKLDWYLERLQELQNLFGELMYQIIPPVARAPLAPL
jgi:hypothetical protein